MALDGGVNTNALEKPSDLGKTPKAKADRWKLELKLADKREEGWRKQGKEIYKLYTPDQPALHAFNILWTNTETLRQSVYNSLPEPDVRRRYSDADPLGKAVSEVLNRSLTFAQDTYDFDGLLKESVLSMLLPGRAVDRVRYVPDIRTVGDVEDKEPQEHEAQEAYEEIEWEQVICERVQWDDFRILCAAKNWNEVTAIGFRHRFTREDCIEKFGDEVGNKITLDTADDEDVKKSSSTVADLFKTAEIWEIWDKDEKEVVWICKTYATPCKVQQDPMKLQGFFPIPKPLYAIENDQTLVPAALYTQYEQQAKELNKVSQRINKLVDTLRVRGIYDATLTEMSELMKGRDNDYIPAQNVTALIDRGGLDKAIWTLPIEAAAAVLVTLNEQREHCKQIIYELTGIADIMRAASDPKETFGAQKIKTQWGTQRLQRMQMEVQRYIRDLIRLKAEIISEKFQPETLEKMTLLPFPHEAQVQRQYQMAMMQAQQAGQPVPPPPQVITWEKVVEAMRGDATRTYRVDIETDSTIAATQEADLQALGEVYKGVAAIVQGLGPAVQSGAIPVEAVKEMILAGVRRVKMGNAVEDALEKMQAPKPPVDPNAGKVEAQKQIEAMKAQFADQAAQRELQVERQKAQIEAQLQAHEQEVQAQQNQHQNALEAAREQQKAALDAQAAQHEAALKAAAEDARLAFEREKMEADNATKVLIAEIQADAAAEKAAATSGPDGSALAPKKDRVSYVDRIAESVISRLGPSLDTQSQTLVQHGQGVEQALQAVSELTQRVQGMGAKEVLRMERIKGSDGRLAGVRKHHADGSVTEVAVQ